MSEPPRRYPHSNHRVLSRLPGFLDTPSSHPSAPPVTVQMGRVIPVGVHLMIIAEKSIEPVLLGNSARFRITEAPLPKTADNVSRFPPHVAECVMISSFYVLVLFRFSDQSKIRSSSRLGPLCPRVRSSMMLAPESSSCTVSTARHSRFQWPVFSNSSSPTLRPLM